jgi:hypothetical protein
MAEDDFDSRKNDHRAFARGDVSIAASIREHGGARHVVEVVDLSQAGFRMRSASFVVPERAIFLTLPDYSPLKARIAWNSDNMYGCEFVQRLHEAIFEHILKRYPQLDAKKQNF